MHVPRPHCRAQGLQQVSHLLSTPASYSMCFLPHQPHQTAPHICMYSHSTLCKQYKAVQSSTKQYKAVQSSTKQYKAVQSSTKQYKAVQSSTKQYKAIQSSTTEHGPLPCVCPATCPARAAAGPLPACPAPLTRCCRCSPQACAQQSNRMWLLLLQRRACPPQTACQPTHSPAVTRSAGHIGMVEVQSTAAAAAAATCSGTRRMVHGGTRLVPSAR
jgi:hypothetical protein